MYKILNSQGLGVASRQNELIELALTHKFQGVEVDMEDLVGRHDTLGKEFACQFLQSAKIDVGTFALPIKMSCSDEDFAAFKVKLDTIADLAETLGGKRCYVPIEPFSEKDSFQENFEKHRERLGEIGDKLGKHSIRTGLALQAAKAKNSTGDSKFIQTAEEILTLVKTIGNSSVGLCLDTWQWVVGDGGMDQLTDVDPAVITELRLADLSENADPASIKFSDRVLPGDGADSFSLKIVNHLLDSGYEGPFSIATDLGMFAGVPRDVVVAKVSQRLDKLIAREPLIEPSEAAEATEEAADDVDSQVATTAQS